MGTDQGPPRLAGHTAMDVNLSEEHIRFTLPGHHYKIGDKVLLVPSHGCTTVNHWDTIHLFRGDEIVGALDVTSRGKYQ
jgi:D-serine deaminase-like pyridoxal phosphate-dependent protein